LYIYVSHNGNWTLPADNVVCTTKPEWLPADSRLNPWVCYSNCLTIISVHTLRLISKTRKRLTVSSVWSEPIVLSFRCQGWQTGPHKTQRL